MLRDAVMTDPQGAAIVIFTPNPKMPSPQHPAPPTHGTNGWHELYSTDLEGGLDFYNKMFGWTKDMDMGRWASIASSMKATTRRWATAE
jgi:hypothetical protein